MAKSFANIRCGAAALLFAASLTGACGGGGGSDNSDDTPVKDSSTPTGTKDAGTDAKAGSSSDAGPITSVPDASSDDLKNALKEDGTDTSMARAMLVFEAACQRAQACDDSAYTSSCVSDYVDQYTAGQAAGFSDDCLDATLDFGACSATVATCDDYFGDGCDDEAHKQESACAAFVGDAG